jgi:hypothetical protein
MGLLSRAALRTSLRGDLSAVAGYASLMNTPALHLGFLAPRPPYCGRFVGYSYLGIASSLPVIQTGPGRMIRGS